jgi:precorrin-2/cobalt-factor-2 C20-methyltransferase
VSTGRLVGIGVGPGDPELITLKAVARLRAVPVVAYVAAGGQPSLARRIAAPHLPGGQREINLALPMSPHRQLAEAAYDEGAARISTELEDGCDVGLLCEGDPLLYGSFIQILFRLGPHYATEVIPGVSGVAAAAAAARLPLAWRDHTFAILPATLPAEVLRARLRGEGGLALIKVGRHLAKVRELLAEAGLLGRAVYVERASTAEQRVLPLAEHEGDGAPYFALVLIGPQRPE